MKIYVIIFLLITLINKALCMDKKDRSKKVEFYFDLDEVLIEKSCVIPHLICGGIIQNLFNSHHYLSSLLGVHNVYTQDSDGIKEALYDKQRNAIEGITFHFLYHGMRDIKLASYVPWLVQTMESKRHFIEGTRELCDYLKNKKGYTIHFATNKDRIAYDITAQTFGNPLTSLASKVFIAHPGNNATFLNDLTQFADQTTTPTNYKQLVQRAINIRQSGNIIHTPGRKPEAQYYQHMLNESDAHTIKIFIDDRKTNVDGFTVLQDTTTSSLHGIHFKNPQQCAAELIKLGFLSESEDQELLKKIRKAYYYPQIITFCCAFMALATVLVLLKKYAPTLSVIFAQ